MYKIFCLVLFAAVAQPVYAEEKQLYPYEKDSYIREDQEDFAMLLMGTGALNMGAGTLACLASVIGFGCVVGVPVAIGGAITTIEGLNRLISRSDESDPDGDGLVKNTADVTASVWNGLKKDLKRNIDGVKAIRALAQAGQ